MTNYAIYQVIVNGAGQTIGFERWTTSYNQERATALADKWCEDYEYKTTFVVRVNAGQKLNHEGQRTQNYFYDALAAGISLI